MLVFDPRVLPIRYVPEAVAARQLGLPVTAVQFAAMRGLVASRRKNGAHCVDVDGLRRAVREGRIRTEPRPVKDRYAPGGGPDGRED